MSHRFTPALRAAVAALLTAVVSLAQTPARPAAGTPRAQAVTPTGNIAGVWQPLPPGQRFTFMKEPAPMQPWAKEQFEYNKNPTVPFGRGRDELEPRYNCLPPGPTGLMLNPHPFEIIQLPGRVLLFHEWDHWVRQIWTDGRGHPEGYPVTYMGHSTGKWDGGTLVVDTVGINEKSSWIDRAGTPHSNALHVVERYRRLDPDTLEIEFLFDDPKTYTKPWGGKKTYQLGPGWEIMEFIVCEDQLKIRGAPDANVEPLR